MGAVALSSSGLPIERERTATLLGFDGPIANTCDALAAVDYLAGSAEVVSSFAAAVRRFLGELLAWRRSEPSSFRFAEAWLATIDPGLPGFRPAAGVERLVATAEGIEAEAEAVRRMALDAPFGPAAATVDFALGRLRTALAGSSELATGTADLVANGLDVNRALLAGRAGRDLTTSGELADYLMTEAGVAPAAARNITVMTVRKAQEQGLESARITPAMIDAAALVVIGREVGVEIEHLGRIFAPRRVLERRIATGAPAPGATRDYLELERTRLLADEQWREEMAARVAEAVAGLRRATEEIVAGASG
jgi:argininosuccinate lyase